MSLINTVEQSTQLQNELNINTETERQSAQGGLTVRTDLRAGIGEDIMEVLKDSWQSLMDKTSSLTN